MNLETAVLKVIGGNGTLNTKRKLPRAFANSRSEESCRPIFWDKNPKNYVAKTQNWDDFPNGRWGSSRSPAFMLEADDGFMSFAKKAQGNPEDKRKIWGEVVQDLDHISDVFCAFVEKKIKKFPFAEGPISAETFDIRDILIKLNKNRFFTINSQPAINGVPSTDPVYGWGPAKGYVFQKAYFEFFVPPEMIDTLVAYLRQYETVSF
jgi:methylenetetrahydrofolate reductase (NADPH)